MASFLTVVFKYWKVFFSLLFTMFKMHIKNVFFRMMTQKIVCGNCGSVQSRSHMTRHQNSKKCSDRKIKKGLKLLIYIYSITSENVTTRNSSI